MASPASGLVAVDPDARGVEHRGEARRRSAARRSSSSAPSVAASRSSCARPAASRACANSRTRTLSASVVAGSMFVRAVGQRVEPLGVDRLAGVLVDRRRCRRRRARSAACSSASSASSCSRIDEVLLALEGLGGGVGGVLVVVGQLGDVVVLRRPELRRGTRRSAPRPAPARLAAVRARSFGIHRERQSGTSAAGEAQLEHLGRVGQQRLELLEPLARDRRARAGAARRAGRWAPRAAASNDARTGSSSSARRRPARRAVAELGAHRQHPTEQPLTSTRRAAASAGDALGFADHVDRRRAGTGSSSSHFFTRKRSVPTVASR